MNGKKARKLRKLVVEKSGKYPDQTSYHIDMHGSTRLEPSCGRSAYKMVKRIYKGLEKAHRHDGGQL